MKMTREEILTQAKPILFNIEMVKAILDGRKTVTRRPVKMKYGNTHIELRTNKYGSNVIELQNNVEGETFGKKPDGTSYQKILAYRDVNPPFKVGNILYVRETWQYIDFAGDENGYVYKASQNGRDWEENSEGWTWKPSIHMPKEAARIFLRVTDVRVERLQDITEDGARAEGIFLDSPDFIPTYHYNKVKCNIPGQGWDTARECFRWGLWDSTVKKSDIDKYGWDANPWVWVIEFERVEVE